MRNKWIRLIVQFLMILVLGYPAPRVNAAGQDSQGQGTRMRQKIDHLQTLIKQRQQGRALTSVRWLSL